MKKIADIMTQDVTLIQMETTVLAAAMKMKERDIGALPVTDGKKIKGMLTDRDIVLRCIAEGKDPTRTRAQDIMTEKVLYVYDDDDVGAAAKSMKDSQVRRLIVLSRDKKLVGFVALADVSRSGGSERLAAQAVKGVSQPTGVQAPAH